MTNYHWTENTRPDRPGIWRFKDTSSPYEVTEGNLSAWLVGTWCFLMDLPIIADPPRWRPVRKGDEGEEIEQNVGVGRELWSRVRFLNYTLAGEIAFERQDGSIGQQPANTFRILDSGDDGEPKREAREWWINAIPDSPVCCCYSSRSQAETMNLPDAQVVHVREVVDESAS